MTRRQAIGVSPFLAAALLLAVKGHEPYAWGHRLTGGCEWVQGPSAAVLGADEPDAGAQRQEFRCWGQHGAKAPGPIPSINLIVRRFPSPAEVAELNGDRR